MTMIEKRGRRHYLIDLPFAAKDAAKSRGAKWDPDARSWWTGKADVAEAIVAAATAKQQTVAQKEREEGIDPNDAVVRGRATYRGKSYYVLYHGPSKKGGTVAKLAFRDGSRVFWAKDANEVIVQKSYERPKSIAGLKAYAERAKSYGTDDCRCRCHDEPNAGAPGSILYDGCDRCGCEAC